jgi:excinuclease ABC subunit C
VTPEAFREIQPNIPTEPGVYQYFDSEDNLLYVGKAKDLRKRVSSYFRQQYDSQRIRVLVRRIARMEFTVVESEKDALLLENSLVKQHQPRYNIQLKDDKSFPFICIRNEPFPRIFMTRRLLEDGSEYLGPYTSAKKTRSILQFIFSMYPIRSCNLNLSARNIQGGKFKICLEYHLGNCLGPCEGRQSEAAYQENLSQIRHILKGSFAPVRRR